MGANDPLGCTKRLILGGSLLEEIKLCQSLTLTMGMGLIWFVDHTHIAVAFNFFAVCFKSRAYAFSFLIVVVCTFGNLWMSLHSWGRRLFDFVFL